MTKRDALSIGVRVVGILELVQFVMYIPTLPLAWYHGKLYGLYGQPLNSTAQRAMAVGETAAAAILLLLALGMIFFGDGIAKALIPHDCSIDLSGILPLKRPAFTLFAQLLGLMLAVRGAEELIGVGVQWAISPPVSHTVVVGESPSDVVTAVLTLALAAYLLTGARHVIDFILRRSPSPAEAQP